MQQAILCAMSQKKTIKQKGHYVYNFYIIIII